MGENQTQTLWSIEDFKTQLNTTPKYRKALIVLTKNMAVKRYQFLRMVLNALNDSDISTLIFDEFTGEITTQDLIKGADVARDFECDLIIGIGGAKTLDAAKIIATLAKNPVEEPLFKKLKALDSLSALDIFAVPTTIHLKSAYSKFALFVDPIQEEIHYLKNPVFTPKKTLILPEIIESLPPDILTLHTLEAYYTATEIYLLTGNHKDTVKNILNTIINTINVNDPKRIKTLLETSIQLSNIHHAITPLEAFERAFLLLHPDIPYGAAQSLCILSYYQKLSKNTLYTERLGDLASLIGVDVIGYDYPKQAERFIEQIKELLKAAQMSSIELRSYGVDSAAISDYVHYTLSILNEKLPFSQEDLYDMFEESLTN